MFEEYEKMLKAEKDGVITYYDKKGNAYFSTPESRALAKGVKVTRYDPIAEVPTQSLRSRTTRGY